jgi:DNA-binding CsgD family transcriptional regulator
LQTRGRFEALTAREQQVVGLVTTGLMNKQIAGELGISEITAKVHRGNVMKKMGARSLADLLRMADALGFGKRRVSRTAGAHPGVLRIAGYLAQDLSTPGQGNQSAVHH